MTTQTSAPTSYTVFPAKSDDLCLSVYTLDEAVEWIRDTAPPGTYDICGYVPENGDYRRVKSVKRRVGHEPR